MSADGVDIQENAEDTTPWLVCSDCKLPLASKCELIEERFETWEEVTWAYQLSILGDEDIWCYSATNPGANRFDVVRVLPSALGRSIWVSGTPTPEHSWFPGYSWSFAHCRQCGCHLGWGFNVNVAPPKDKPESPDAADVANDAADRDPSGNFALDSEGLKLAGGSSSKEVGPENGVGSDQLEVPGGEKVENTESTKPSIDLNCGDRGDVGNCENSDECLEHKTIDASDAGGVSGNGASSTTVQPACQVVEIGAVEGGVSSETEPVADEQERESDKDVVDVGSQVLARPDVVFFGLILTRTRERILTDTVQRELFEKCKDYENFRAARLRTVHSPANWAELATEGPRVGPGRIARQRLASLIRNMRSILVRRTRSEPGPTEANSEIGNELVADMHVNEGENVLGTALPSLDPRDVPGFILSDHHFDSDSDADLVPSGLLRELLDDGSDDGSDSSDVHYSDLADSDAHEQVLISDADRSLVDDDVDTSPHDGDRN